MVNGNTGIVGIAADLIGGVKENLLGVESVLTPVNMLGMTRPLAQINIAEQLRAGGGIIPSLQTGVKKMTAARKGGSTGGTSAPAKRYRPPASPPAQPARTSQALEQPEELEIIL